MPLIVSGALVVPVPLLRPFAFSGSKNTIPQTTGVAPNDATWLTGFPDVTMLPPTAGGQPPKGKDFNGVLNSLSANAAWLCAGMTYSYDANVSAYIGGYKQGALLRSANPATPLLYFFCVTDANTNDPDVDATGWAAFTPAGAKYVSANVPAGTSNNYAPTGFDLTTATLDLNPNGGNATLSGLAAGFDGQRVTLSNVHATNAVTLSRLDAGSASANQFRGPAGFTLAAGSSVDIKYSAGVSKWIVIA